MPVLRGTFFQRDPRHISVQEMPGNPLGDSSVFRPSSLKSLQQQRTLGVSSPCQAQVAFCQEF